MKATIQIPNDLYREVKAKTAREGRTVREITIRLYEQWLGERDHPGSSAPELNWRTHKAPLAHLMPDDVTDHSMESIRKSIAKNWDEPN